MHYHGQHRTFTFSRKVGAVRLLEAPGEAAQAFGILSSGAKCRML